MKVKELIEFLNAFDEDVRVLITWEGIFVDIHPEDIYRSKGGSIILDADNCNYKDDIVSGRLVPLEEK